MKSTWSACGHNIKRTHRRCQSRAKKKRARVRIGISVLNNHVVHFHTQMPYLQLADGSAITVQKDVKGALAHANKGVVRRMFVVNNEPFAQATTQR